MRCDGDNFTDDAHHQASCHRLDRADFNAAMVNALRSPRTRAGAKPIRAPTVHSGAWSGSSALTKLLQEAQIILVEQPQVVYA